MAYAAPVPADPILISGADREISAGGSLEIDIPSVPRYELSIVATTGKATVKLGRSANNAILVEKDVSAYGPKILEWKYAPKIILASTDGVTLRISVERKS